MAFVVETRDTPMLTWRPVRFQPIHNTLEEAKNFARGLDEDGLLLLGPTLRIMEHGKTLKWVRSDLLDTSLAKASEKDGEAADIRYRADMKDAGRGHLLR